MQGASNLVTLVDGKWYLTALSVKAERAAGDAGPH